MGRSYLGYRENISTSLQARSRLVMKWYEKLHCGHMRRKVLPATEMSLADRRDLGDRDNSCLIGTQLLFTLNKIYVTAGNFAR